MSALFITVRWKEMYRHCIRIYWSTAAGNKVMDFHTNRHSQYKRPSLLVFAIRNGSAVTYVTSSIFIENPTFRFYSSVHCLFVLVLK